MSLTTEYALTVATKHCGSCGNLKWLNQFPVNHPHCRECRDAYQVKWRNNNRGKINENQRTYHATINGRASILLNAALKRARQKGDEFLLPIEHVIDGLTTGFCRRTLLPFDMSISTRGGAEYHINPYAPSIDKIDPYGIYEPENVQYVCAWYNLAKGQMSEILLIEFCKRVTALNT